MSIGPKIPGENPGPGKVEKFAISVKKSFKEPSHLIFNLTLTGIIGCLFFQVYVDWRLWIILLLLGAFNLFRYFEKNDH